MVLMWRGFRGFVYDLGKGAVAPIQNGAWIIVHENFLNLTLKSVNNSAFWAN